MFSPYGFVPGQTVVFRDYKIDSPQGKLYYNMYLNQTVDFVKSQNLKYSNLDNCVMRINDVLKLMDNFVDPSDPDISLPNSIHAYQTAETIRKKYPENKELQICGLIHDLGKILYTFNEPEWSIVGDTFVVGCKYTKNIIYNDFLRNNPDYSNTKYNSLFGIYKKNCGIENLLLSFGHDEYLFKVLQNNKHNLSKRYQNIIRFHSFYPWHSNGEYTRFMSRSDKMILEDVINFNKFDLYSKKDKFILTEEIKSYYNKLLCECFPNPLKW